MKKILFFVLITFFFSCGSTIKPAYSENITIDKPELNTITKTEIGITLVSTEVGFKCKALKITKGRKVKPGYIVKEIKNGDIYLNLYDIKTHELYINSSDPTFGIALPIKGGKPQAFNSTNAGATVFSLRDTIEFDEMMMPVPEKPYFKQEFIYNGKVGNAVKFIYREYIDDYIRPAFFQDLQYDLSEGKIIGFKGLRIEIINATNTQIEYKVINHFDKAN